MSAEWDTRAEAWQARKHSTTIRRSRKGGDNSRTYRRGLAPVIGSLRGIWSDEVPEDVANAILDDILDSHEMVLGTAGLDLAKIVDRYADVLGIEPLLGTEGSSKGFRQVFHVAKASPGADVMDVVAICGGREYLTSWADSPGARAAFQSFARFADDSDWSTSADGFIDDSYNMNHREDKLEWPDRKATTARSRKSESDVAGPRVPGTDGKLHRTGNLYGTAFTRTGKRYTPATRRQAVPVWPRVTYRRTGFIGRQIGAPCLYGTLSGWARLTPWQEWRSPGVTSITDHSGRPVEWSWLNVTDDPNYDKRDRVFIGHRSIVRGDKAKQTEHASHNLGAFKLRNVSDVRYLVDLMVPETFASVDYGETFGTVSRAASGRFSISVDTPTGKARHQPRGAAACVEYLMRYLVAPTTLIEYVNAQGFTGNLTVSA